MGGRNMANLKIWAWASPWGVHDRLGGGVGGVVWGGVGGLISKGRAGEGGWWCERSAGEKNGAVLLTFTFLIEPRDRQTTWT